MKWLALIFALAFATPVWADGSPHSGIGDCIASSQAVGRLNANAPPTCASSLSASVNNVLNVMAPPYNAKNDNVTDDTTAIQQAIYDVEGATPPTFPPYLISRTVYLPASTKVISGIRACYSISKPLRVASGPIEIKGDSGSCITKTYAGPTIITEAWGTGYLTYGPALVGTGASISTIGCTSGNFCTNGIIDLSQYLNTSAVSLAAAFATGFDIEFWMEPTSFVQGGPVLGSEPSPPGSGNGMFKLTLSTTTGLVTATVNTTGGLVSLTACPGQTLSTAYDMALDWDGTTYRLFQGGTLCSSSSSSSAPVQGPFEAMMLPDLGHFGNWMAGGASVNPFQGYLDEIRFETQSLHTSNYTPPTTRFTADSKTILLIDPAATNVDGTQVANEAYWYGQTNVYFPILGVPQGAGMQGLHLHNLELCANNGSTNKTDGFFAQWSNNMEIDHVSCGQAVYAGLNFYNNDYGTFEHDNYVGYGMLGILHGVAWNGSLAQNDRMDDQTIACELTTGNGGGNFHDIHQDCTNRGALYYCKMYMNIGFVSQSDYDTCDEEASDSNFVASILLTAPLVPITFISPDIAAVANKPFIDQDGGGVGATIIGGQFQVISATPSYLIDYTNGTPSTPTRLNNTVNPIGVPISNLMPSVVHDNGCRGSVTLSSGSGVFSDQCLFSNDRCSGVDTTTAANGPATAFAFPTIGRSEGDGVTNTDTSLVSATLAFVAGDVGRRVHGSGISEANGGTFIASRTNGTTVVLSQATTATATGVFITLDASSAITAGTGSNVMAELCQ